nr:zinc finger, CCHC-type [Tanacetum cinerariifolium]
MHNAILRKYVTVCEGRWYVPSLWEIGKASPIEGFLVKVCKRKPMGCPLTKITGLPPPLFLSTLLSPLFLVSLNPTTLSLLLPTLGDAAQSDGVTALAGLGLGSICLSSSGDYGIKYHGLYFGRKIPIEMENVGLTNGPLPYFCRRPTAKGVGLRVADSRTGNHSKDDFMPLETIRRLCSVFWRRSHLGFKRETSEPKRRYRQLRLVLSTEDKENYLEHPIPAALIAPSGHQVPLHALAAHDAWVKGQKEVVVLMLLTMDLEIQQNLAHLGAYDMLRELKAMYSKQAKQELLQTVREFHISKQEGELQYARHRKSVNELHVMLKLHEEMLPKKDDNPTLHTIRAGRVQKNKPHKAAKGVHGKSKGKMGYALNNALFTPKAKTPSPPKKDNHAKDTICHKCLRESKKLKPGALSLYVGDGHRVAIEAIGTYHLELPSGLVIVLNNFHYASSITRGYPKETIGYSFYSPSDNKVFVALNAELFELKLLDLKASGSVEDLEVIQEEDINPSIDTSLNHEEDNQEIDEPQSDINPIRKSFRTRHAPDHMCLYIDAEEHKLGDLDEPANYKVTLLDPESKKWLDAMNVEMQSMKDNDVWVLLELPLIARTIGSKWLFKKKTDMDGAVYIFKACLVAKGFTQTYGVDYEETFSPIADIRAIRILIAIATYYEYEIWQMDVKTTFQSTSFRRKHYKPFSTRSGEEHWIAVKNILKYLRNTKDIFMVYGGNTERELRVSCYTDVGYLTDADNLKSQTGYVFVLNGGVVDWKKAVWICKLIFGLGIVPTIEEHISMYYDNTGAIEISKDDGVTKGARHFYAKVHYHYLRETIKFDDVKMEKIDTDDNLDDPFTKVLAFPKHSELIRNIRLLPASSFM